MVTANQATVDSSVEEEPVMLMEDVSMMSGSLPNVQRVQRKYEPRTWLHNSNNAKARLRKLRSYINPNKPGPNLYARAVSSGRNPLSPRD